MSICHLRSLSPDNHFHLTSKNSWTIRYREIDINKRYSLKDFSLSCGLVNINHEKRRYKEDIQGGLWDHIVVLYRIFLLLLLVNIPGLVEEGGVGEWGPSNRDYITNLSLINFGRSNNIPPKVCCFGRVSTQTSTRPLIDNDMF